MPHCFIVKVTVASHPHIAAHTASTTTQSERNHDGTHSVYVANGFAVDGSSNQQASISGTDYLCYQAKVL